jgi:hypothetical protein
MMLSALAGLEQGLELDMSSSQVSTVASSATSSRSAPPDSESFVDKATQHDVEMGLLASGSTAVGSPPLVVGVRSVRPNSSTPYAEPRVGIRRCNESRAARPIAIPSA